jgi:hypothetical protein
MPLTQPYLDNIFTYHKPFADQTDRYEQLRAKAKEYAELVIKLTPDSPEQQLAIRDIQRSVMMANAAIAVNEPDSNWIAALQNPD